MVLTKDQQKYILELLHKDYSFSMIQKMCKKNCLVYQNLHCPYIKKTGFQLSDRMKEGVAADGSVY